MCKQALSFMRIQSNLTLFSNIVGSGIEDFKKLYKVTIIAL